jgi:hypothetical protein
MFLHTADENYIAARWCFMQNLHTDFFWLGTHALEKYMKAVLLFNDRSVKMYGHDVLGLYGEVRSLAADLLPVTLTQPTGLEGINWSDRTLLEFVDHLHRNGNPDNRYLTYGYSARSQDLHMLDATVYAIRRLICFLDEPLQLMGRPRSLPDPPSYRHFLANQPEYTPVHFMPLDKLISESLDGPLRFAALNQNLSFAPDTYQHEPMRGGSAGRNPVLVRRIFDQFKSNDKAQIEDGIASAEWLLENTRVSGDGKSRKGIAAEIADAVEDAKKTLASLPTSP